MLNLEVIALQRNLLSINQQQQQQASSEAAATVGGADEPVALGGDPESAASGATLSAVLSAGGKVQAGMLQAVRAAARNSATAATTSGLPQPLPLQGVGAGGQLAEEKALWMRRLDQVQSLLSTVALLHSQLMTLCEKPEVRPVREIPEFGQLCECSCVSVAAVAVII